MAHDSLAATHTPVEGFSARLARGWAALAEWRRREDTEARIAAELGALSDRDLADIGLRRGMIPDIARQAAARR
jgi:uncharacterized protein YjiS (DUF1127 family)